DDLIPTDRRHAHPRFQKGNFERNLELLKPIERIAQERGWTASQVALAWVLAKGEDVVPIPGTKRRRYLEQNVAAVDLSLGAAEIEALDAAFPPNIAAGLRYPEFQLRKLLICAHLAHDGPRPHRGEPSELRVPLSCPAPAERMPPVSGGAPQAPGTGLAGVLENVHARAPPVDQVKASELVGPDVVRLDAFLAVGDRGDVVSDLLGPQRVADVDGAQPGIEVGEEDQIL